jgi:UDP-N-acetylglucosamine pyrophosphorylase
MSGLQGVKLELFIFDTFPLAANVALRGPIMSGLQGVKLELFIFDTFPLAENVALLEARREEEFAPVKNAPGAPSDSPDTARRAILQLHQKCALPSAPSMQLMTFFATS